ncbi:MAG: hypothetical protein QNJ72_09190 [Pleurocapsa sp. MO_226.B13]|nr:hypothetical protein [Pleurocapsa sp. MO_226.B13]
MPSIKTSVSIPQDEATILDKAYDRIFQVSGYPVVTNSEVFRIGLRAILRLDKQKLSQCVDECPQQTPGRKACKEREQMTGDEIKDFFDL